VDSNDAYVKVYYDICSNTGPCSSIPSQSLSTAQVPSYCVYVHSITYSRGDAWCTHKPKVLNGTQTILSGSFFESGSFYVDLEDGQISDLCTGNNQCCFNLSNSNDVENFNNLLQNLRNVDGQTDVNILNCFVLTSDNSSSLDCCNTKLKYKYFDDYVSGGSYFFVFKVEDGCDNDYNDAYITVQISVCIN
ncbi:MAG: hypothetical protein NZZ41_07860, partial [Candidatus Dojkabacteria bacterium]|nr:hypothetical protein [Candidatus Dojkabacteria bacterium]